MIDEFNETTNSLVDHLSIYVRLATLMFPSILA